MTADDAAELIPSSVVMTATSERTADYRITVPYLLHRAYAGGAGFARVRRQGRELWPHHIPNVCLPPRGLCSAADYETIRGEAAPIVGAQIWL
jgi:hypothetical protein